MPHEKLLTAVEVADRLRISRRATYRLRAEHRIGCVQIRGTFRFREADVEEFIKRNTERPTVVGLRRARG